MRIQRGGMLMQLHTPLQEGRGFVGLSERATWSWQLKDMSLAPEATIQLAQHRGLSMMGDRRHALASPLLHSL